MSKAYLIMVVVAFTVFILTLGAVWIRNYVDDLREARLKKGRS